MYPSELTLQTGKLVPLQPCSIPALHRALSAARISKIFSVLQVTEPGITFKFGIHLARGILLTRLTVDRLFCQHSPFHYQIMSGK